MNDNGISDYNKVYIDWTFVHIHFCCLPNRSAFVWLFLKIHVYEHWNTYITVYIILQKSDNKHIKHFFSSHHELIYNEWFSEVHQLTGHNWDYNWVS